MSLVKCPDCSQEVSNRALGCPGCGYPVFQLTSLHDIVSRNRNAFVPDMLKAGAKINEKDSRGRTALMIASANGNFEIAKILIDAGANPNQQGNNAVSSLMEAASH